MSRASLLLVLAGVGCVVAEPDLETTAHPLVAEDGCPPKECGSNSSVINGVHFYELSKVLGVPNGEGVKVLGYQGLPPLTTQLDVYKNELVARNAAGTVVKKGYQLIGSTFVLQVRGNIVHLFITDFHRTLRYWADDDPTQLLSSYTFQYITFGPDGSSIPTPLCTVEDLGDGAASLDAFVFEGDRYDPKTKKVSAGWPTTGWFNIACMGGAPAKMFRMRATNASIRAGVNMPVAQKQSLFNLWIGNYCGDGTSFTVPGEPLRVRDSASWIPLTSAWSWTDADGDTDGIPDALGSYEAVWGPGGAVCLDTPRRDDDAPGYRTVIADHCTTVGHELPTCSEAGVFPHTWQPSGRYASANPAAE